MFVCRIEETRNAHRILVKRPCMISAWKEEEMDYININFKEMSCGDERWMVLAHDCVQ
jgi:hypothetical protein